MLTTIHHKTTIFPMVPRGPLKGLKYLYVSLALFSLLCKPPLAVLEAEQVRHII